MSDDDDVMNVDAPTYYIIIQHFAGGKRKKTYKN